MDVRQVFIANSKGGFLLNPKAELSAYPSKPKIRKKKLLKIIIIKHSYLRYCMKHFTDIISVDLYHDTVNGYYYYIISLLLVKKVRPSTGLPKLGKLVKTQIPGPCP